MRASEVLDALGLAVENATAAQVAGLDEGWEVKGPEEYGTFYRDQDEEDGALFVSPEGEEFVVRVTKLHRGGER